MKTIDLVRYFLYNFKHEVTNAVTGAGGYRGNRGVGALRANKRLGVAYLMALLLLTGCGPVSKITGDPSPEPTYTIPGFPDPCPTGVTFYGPLDLCEYYCGRGAVKKTSDKPHKLTCVCQ
jgi:hypothetical protein